MELVQEDGMAGTDPCVGATRRFQGGNEPSYRSNSSIWHLKDGQERPLSGDVGLFDSILSIHGRILLFFVVEPFLMKVV